MIIENKQKIKKIIMKPTASCFCPLGQDWYKIDFNISFMPKDFYPDYCDVQNFISNNINKQQLTIEEAASRAGVGTKTWSRYEAGESIRVDKSKGICRALNWRAFPDEESEDDNLLSVIF